MRRSPLLIASAAVLALCGGCATEGGMKAQPSAYLSSLDTEVIAAVENSAINNGVHVVWIHPPRKAKQPKQ